MTSAFGFTHDPSLRLRLRLMVTGVWLTLVIALISWWGWVVWHQARHIVELESQLGLSAESVGLSWKKTQRMLVWESGTFIVLLAGITLVLAILQRRDFLRAKSTHAFFASVTHELKTPLTSIRLQAETLADRVEDERVTLLTRRLLEDTARLESQVERTLELARVEGGGRVLKEAVSLKSAVQRAFHQALGGPDQVIPFELKRLDGIWVLGDPAAIAMVFRNLIENSYRHSGQEKPGISVDFETVEERRVRVRYADRGKGYSGSSKDLGQLFHKGAGSMGTGVGLYLIRLLMDKMGGSAEFKSSAGAGFSAYLDFRKADAHE